jgi:tripartite-type tricarboxylate transporter receptor subunit TctC
MPIRRSATTEAITRRATLGLLALAAPLGAARAQEAWPRQPLRILIPFAPGGVPDIAARLLAPGLQAALGQPVIVENRPGGGGTVAAEVVARSAPDGHTLLMTTASTQAIAPSLFPALRYDAERDLAPVSFIARVPHVLLVPPSLGVTTVQELVALLKREPGKHNYASSGVGAPPHLAGELFRMQAELDAAHVAYRGSTPALTDLVAGRVSYLIDALPPAAPFIREGKLRALGVGTKERARLMPELPTIAEQGLPEFESYTWAALYTTGGSPQPALARLSAEVQRAAKAPEVAARMAELGYELVASDAPTLARIQRGEAQKWGGVIRRAGIQPES